MPHALHRERRSAGRHDAAAKIRGGHVRGAQGRHAGRGSALPHLDVRDHAGQQRARGDPPGRITAHAADGSHAMLPLGSRQLWQGHARDDPPASVRQGRARAGRAARALLRGAGGTDRARRAHPAAPRAALSGHGAVHRRHGLCRRQDLRPRSVAARAAGVSRDLVVLQLRSVPGAAHAGPLSQRAGQAGARAHAQRVGPRDRPHARRGDGELPGSRRLHRRAGRAAAVHGRGHESHYGGVTR